MKFKVMHFEVITFELMHFEVTKIHSSIVFNKDTVKDKVIQ